MGKEKNPRRVEENEAMAKTRMLKVSPQKLNLVAASIRGLHVSQALAELSFSKKRAAQDVKKTLQSAIANAENNHGLDVDELVVAEAWGRQESRTEAWPAAWPGSFRPHPEAVCGNHHQGAPTA